jgi:hypothetical protein
MSQTSKNSAKSSTKQSVYKAPTSKERDYVDFELIERSNDPMRPFRPLHILSTKDYIYDEATGKERGIRYLQGASSIFIDEQNIDPAFAIAGQIEFHRGRIRVQKTQSTLLAYLRATNQNEAKTARNTSKPPVFRELVPELDAEKEFDLMNGRRKAVETAWHDVDNNMEAVYHYARVLGINTSTLSEKHIINKYIEKAEKDPQTFLKYHKSPRNTHKYFAITAFDKGVVNSRDVAGTVTWSDTKGVITAIPAGKDAVDYLTDFLMDSENEKTYELLKEKVLELK